MAARRLHIRAGALVEGVGSQALGVNGNGAMRGAVGALADEDWNPEGVTNA